MTALAAEIPVQGGTAVGEAFKHKLLAESGDPVRPGMRFQEANLSAPPDCLRNLQAGLRSTCEILVVVVGAQRLLQIHLHAAQPTTGLAGRPGHHPT